MRVLIAATPLTGHLNPLLAIGHTLMNEGCKVLGLSANIMRDRFERLGAPFRAFPGRADVDLSDRDVAFPEWRTIPPGPGRLRFALEQVYIDAIHAQHQGLQRVLEEFPADVILGDNFLFGVLPMLLGQHAKRPAIVLCGTMLLHCRRDDGAPHFAGLPPARSAAQREKYAAISKEHDRVIYDPVKRHLNESLARLGVAPVATDLFHAMVALQIGRASCRERV